MKEINEQLLRMQNNVNTFMIRKDVPQKLKDGVAREFNKTLDTVIDLTSPITIERLVYKEGKKKQ